MARPHLPEVKVVNAGSASSRFRIASAKRGSGTRSSSTALVSAIRPSAQRAITSAPTIPISASIQTQP